jgi:hypothetical protein
MIERESDKRFLKNRYERFGEIICQRTQTGTASGGQNECLGDLVHGQKIRDSSTSLGMTRKAAAIEFQDRRRERKLVWILFISVQVSVTSHGFDLPLSSRDA